MKLQTLPNLEKNMLSWSPSGILLQYSNIAVIPLDHKFFAPETRIQPLTIDGSTCDFCEFTVV